MENQKGSTRKHSGTELATWGVALFGMTLLVQWIMHRVKADPNYSFGQSALFALVLATIAIATQAWWERRRAE